VRLGDKLGKQRAVDGSASRWPIVEDWHGERLDKLAVRSQDGNRARRANVNAEDHVSPRR
jgi:hypothetical protein